MATVLLLIKNSLKFVSFRQLLKVEGRSLIINPEHQTFSDSKSSTFVPVLPI